MKSKVSKRDICLCMTQESVRLLVTKLKLLQMIHKANPDKRIRTISYNKVTTTLQKGDLQKKQNSC